MLQPRRGWGLGALVLLVHLLSAAAIVVNYKVHNALGLNNALTAISGQSVNDGYISFFANASGKSFTLTNTYSLVSGLLRLVHSAFR
jgi:hypothetical protein